MTCANLTQNFVVKAKAESGAERSIYWDEALAGFGLMVTSAGHRSIRCAVSRLRHEPPDDH